MSPRVLVKVMEMLLSLVRALFGRRADLALENLALRQQVPTTTSTVVSDVVTCP